jgi:O-antigen/teichoic acid export membrane protein
MDSLNEKEQNRGNVYTDTKPKYCNGDRLVLGASVGSSIISSSRWTGLSSVGTQSIKFVTSIILARLLAPQDFGLMAMALVVTGFVEIFKDLGTGSVIIQRSEISRDLLDTLFWANIVFGFLTGGGVSLCAPVIAGLYGASRLGPIFQVLGLTFVFSSCAVVKNALLHRDMRFGRLAFVEMSVVVIQGVVAVWLAVIGWGVWALVAGTIGASIASTSLLWQAVPWRPRFFFRWQDFSSVFRFSFNLTGANIFNFLINNADKVIVGRFLGATPLGYYALAQKILMTPIYLVSLSLTRVLFPGFSKIQDDNTQLQQKYLRACGAIVLIIFPALAGICILAAPFVNVMLGAKWGPVIPLIMIMSPAGTILSLSATTGVIYLVKGRTNWMLWWAIFSGTLSIFGLIIGLRWGVVGVATGYLMALTLLTYPGFAIPLRLISLRLVDLLTELFPYAAGTFIMILSVLGFRFALERFGFGYLFVLFACVMVGVVVYASFVVIVRPQGLYDVRRLLFLNEGLKKMRRC